MKNYFLPNKPTEAWIREWMKDGPSLQLAKQVEKTWDWSQSQFITPHTGKTEKEMLEFRFGGKFSTDETDQWLLDTTRNLFGKSEHLFIVEDWRKGKTDKILKNLENSPPYRFIDDEFYYIFPVNKELTDREFRIIFSNTLPSFHAFIVDGENMNFETETDLIDTLSRKVLAIICGSYDGESYIFCHKQGFNQ